MYYRFLLGCLAFSSWGGMVYAQNLTLPDVNTNAGLLARLFLAECLNPGYKEYDADLAQKGMRAMQAVVDNRLKHNPAQFGAPGAKGYVEIVGAAGQFEGFSLGGDGKIAIADKVRQRIEAIVKTANTGPPGKYAAFVRLAIDTAQAPVDDPFKDVTKIGDVVTTGGGYGWRTAGSGSPGGRFVAIPESAGGVISGNQFYALKK